MNSIWDNCLAKLENEISNADFSTWIRPLQAIESTAQIKLLAPNRFVLDWIKQHYFSKIESTIHEFSNGRLSFHLEIGSKKSTTIATLSNIKPLEIKTFTPNFLNRAFTFDNFV
jgi:chromosomal replication initiator protein